MKFMNGLRSYVNNCIRRFIERLGMVVGKDRYDVACGYLAIVARTCAHEQCTARTLLFLQLSLLIRLNSYMGGSRQGN